MKKLLSLILFTSISCKESVSNPDNEYIDRNSNTLELRQLSNSRESSNNVYGSYFLIGGSIQGKVETKVSVKVFAKVDGYFRVLSIPIQKLRVNIDNDLEKPTLIIKYNDMLLTDSQVIDNCYNLIYVINCPEKYLPEKLLPIEI